MEEFGTQKGGQGGPVHLRTADCHIYLFVCLLLCPVLVKIVIEEQTSLVGYVRSHASSKYTKLISFFINQQTWTATREEGINLY